MAEVVRPCRDGQEGRSRRARLWLSATLLIGAVGAAAVVGMGAAGRMGGEATTLEGVGQQQSPLFSKLRGEDKHRTAASLQRLASVHSQTGGRAAVGSGDEYPAVSYFAKLREQQSTSASSGPGFPQQPSRGGQQQLQEQGQKISPAQSMNQAKMAHAFAKLSPPKPMSYSQLREAYLKSREGNGGATAAPAATGSQQVRAPGREPVGRGMERQGERVEEERRQHERGEQGDREEDDRRGEELPRHEGHRERDEGRRGGWSRRGEGYREEDERMERERGDDREREDEMDREREGERERERRGERRGGRLGEGDERGDIRHQSLREGGQDRADAGYHDERMPDDDEFQGEPEDNGDGERDAYGDRKPIAYPEDAMPVAAKATKEERMRAIEAKEQAIRVAQAKLKKEWGGLMKKAPAVDEDTRPDIIDTEYPTSTGHFHRKKKEMLTFRAVLHAFESDPEFNPVIVLQAHHLERYGIPAPETDNIRVWQRWYREAYDKYKLVKREVEDIASGRWHRSDAWKKHHIHREDAYKAIHREDVYRPPIPFYGRRVSGNGTNSTAEGVEREKEAEVPEGGVDAAALERRVADMEKELHGMEGLLKARGQADEIIGGASDDDSRLGETEPAAEAVDAPAAGDEGNGGDKVVQGKVVGEDAPAKAQEVHPPAPAAAAAAAAPGEEGGEEEDFPHDTGDDTGHPEADFPRRKAVSTASLAGKGRAPKLICAKGSCRPAGEGVEQKHFGGGREAGVEVRGGGGGARGEGGLMQTGPVPGKVEPLKMGEQALSKHKGGKARGEGGVQERGSHGLLKGPPLEAKFVGGKVMYVPKYDHSKTGDHNNRWLW